MKIGILSLVLHTNYGGILQSYALKTVLERMGYEVVVFTKDRDIHRSIPRQWLSFMAYCVRKFLLRRNVKYKGIHAVNRERRIREQHILSFITKYIAPRVVEKLDAEAFGDVEAVVVGSDQVWRKRYFEKQWNTRIPDAYLGFLEQTNLKKISFAASFGTDEWEYTEEDTKECARLLKKFDAVSVRETSGIRLCKERLGRGDAQHLLDPTFLLNKSDYIKLVQEAGTPKSSGNLLCYVLDMDGDKKELINRIAKGKNYVPFSVNSQVTTPTAPLEECILPSLEQWLRGFMDAEFVVTDSFHACVFSIIFGKPFVVVGNKERGMTRFSSLLSTFGLEQNLVCSSEEYDAQNSYSVSDCVYNLLEEKREMSFSYLKNNLS